jgi:hypothetical protein
LEWKPHSRKDRPCWVVVPHTCGSTQVRILVWPDLKAINKAIAIIAFRRLQTTKLKCPLHDNHTRRVVSCRTHRCPRVPGAAVPNAVGASPRLAGPFIMMAFLSRFFQQNCLLNPDHILHSKIQSYLEYRLKLHELLWTDIIKRNSRVRIMQPKIINVVISCSVRVSCTVRPCVIPKRKVKSHKS